MNKDYIKDAIVAKLGNDVVVSFTEVEKNGVMKKAIKVQKHNAQIAPVFYYNPDDSDDKIVNFIVDGFAKNGNPGLNVDELADNLANWSWVKDRIYPRLYNADKGNSVTNVANYVLAGDVNVCFSIMLSDDDKTGTMTTKVLWNMFDEWGISMDELTKTAKANLNKMLVMDSMMNILFLGIADNTKERKIDMSDAMTVCTTINKTCGASAILLLPDLIDNGEIDDMDYYILPSSIHETIVLKGYDSGFKSMVKCVNATQVAPDDFLSDNVFKYNAATREFEVMK